MRLPDGALSVWRSGGGRGKAETAAKKAAGKRLSSPTESRKRGSAACSSPLPLWGLGCIALGASCPGWPDLSRAQQHPSFFLVLSEADLKRGGGGGSGLAWRELRCLPPPRTDWQAVLCQASQLLLCTCRTQEAASYGKPARKCVGSHTNCPILAVYPCV